MAVCGITPLIKSIFLYISTSISEHNLFRHKDLILHKFWIQKYSVKYLIMYLQVHLKKLEYGEKVNLFQKAKHSFIFDILHFKVVLYFCIFF